MPQLMRLLAAAVLVTACAQYSFSSDGGSLVSDGGADAGLDGGELDGSVDDAGTFIGFDPDAGFPICVDVGRPITLSPVDLYLLLDVSGSMDYDQKWVAVRAALNSFVGKSEFAGLGIAVQYFPLRTLCSVPAYEVPAVRFAQLPGIAPMVTTSLAEQRMSGGTPTATALAGAYSYTRDWMAQPANANRKAAVVLATDGVPDGTCSGPSANTIPNVVVVAGGAAAASPPIKTFVIGVGQELAPLDAIADAGGTGNAVLVDAAGNADVQFLDALTRIRRDALGCDFEIPFDKVIDTTKSRVVFLPSSGAAVNIPAVDSVSDCTPTSAGYYFDSPVNPRVVTLCPVACNLITSGRTGQLKVELACGIQ